MNVVHNHVIVDVIHSCSLIIINHDVDVDDDDNDDDYLRTEV